MAIWLHVDTHNGIPLYILLIDQIKHALTVGTLSPGDSLPTVRELASELALAPNTIAKAYNELQRMGLIESRPGKGTIVLGEAEETLRPQRIAALKERLSLLVSDASTLGLSQEELRAWFEHAAGQSYPQLQHQGEE